MEKRKNFVIGIPCKDAIHPFLVDFLIKNKINNVIIEQGYWVLRNRNKIIKRFLKDYKEDYLIFIDSDTIPKMEWINMVIESKLDVVGIPYPVGELKVSCLNTETNKWYTLEEYKKLIGNYKFKEVQVVDAGCLCIHRKVLKTLEEPWWQYPPEEYRMSEAIPFCYTLCAKGFNVYSLIGALCDHYKGNLNLVKFFAKQEKKEIPKIIHQIWIGDKEIPHENYTKTIKDKHPKWKYILWDKKRLLKEKIISKNLYNYFIKNPGTMPSNRKYTKYDKNRFKKASFFKISDIARYNILRKYGGVYIDIDIICLKPLDRLVESNEFFVGFEGEKRVSGLIGNSVIGCIPEHPAIVECVNKLENTNRKLITKTEAVLITGPYFLTKVLTKYNDITVYSHRLFYPILYESQTVKKLKNLNASIFKDSYLIHAWGINYGS